MVKNKVLVRSVYLIVILFSILSVTAQNSNGINSNATRAVFELYKSENFESLIQDLSNRQSLNVTESFLLELSKIRLGGDNVTTLEELVKANARHPLSGQSNYYIGKHYFHNQSIQLASSFLKSVNLIDLSNDEKKAYFFMRGYLEMKNEAFKNASNYFDRSVKISQRKSSQLSYYQGYTSYHLNNEDLALAFFKEVDSDSEYRNSANFFKAKILLNQAKYGEVIELTQTQLTEEKSVTNSALYQVIGESFALQGEADKATNYFDRAIELHPGSPSAALYYQAGVANFKLGLKDKAIEYLRESGIRSGDYAQLSAFQLARLYLSRDDFDQALTAYVEASASTNPEIKEESFFNAGKLLLAKGDFSEGINYLNDYAKTFTNGKFEEESQQLLSEAYLRTSNYDQAIAHLKQVGTVTNDQKAIYQKVTYQKGHLLYQDGLNPEALIWLKESLLYPNDSELASQSYYTIGEIYFEEENYQAAIKNYLKQPTQKQETAYSIGYSYYNLYQYEQAVAYFKRFLDNPSQNEIKIDARVRLADCYYATKNYSQAEAYYSRLISEVPNGYLYFQLGLANKGLGKSKEAEAAFQNVLDLGDSNLDDDALFQLAQLSFEGASFAESEFKFSTLISKHPNSLYLPEAYLNRAVSRNNLNKLPEARDDFQIILDEYLNSPIAFNAILGLQELSGKGVTVKNLAKQIERYRKANPDDKSLESVEFEFAKSQYFNSSYDRAVNSFSRFLDSYSESVNAIDAKYYIADSYYRMDSLSEAKKYFEELTTVRNNLTGRIHWRLGEINYRLEEFAKAITAYSNLISLNLTPKDTYNGRSGLMKSHMSAGNWSEAIVSADIIMNGEWKPLNAERNAILVKGNAYKNLGDLVKAKAQYELINKSLDVISAEASFNLGLLLFEAKEFEQSLEVLFELNATYGSYTEWIDKSYLLIADNYMKMDDLFQAKATLRSIIQHSENQKTKNLAQERLLQIENQVINDTIVTDSTAIKN